MHYDIECFYNNIDTSNNSVEYEYFKAFVKEYRHLKPYRTEWMIYDKELQLAGSIDMIFENEDGTLSIYDWKRSKEIKKTSPWNKFSKTECIEHIPDTNYWHYCLQLNTYKAILEKNYNKQIKDMYLVCLHPDNKNHSYQRIKVVTLNKEITSLFDLRKEQLK
jgi:ATP-dependent exoDNAse (exonuclease V) beta subunit